MNHEPNEEREYPHWNRVYAAVLIWTFILIALLWLITRRFS